METGETLGGRSGLNHIWNKYAERVSLLWDLAVNDLRRAEKDTVLGWGWTFVRPAVSLIVYYVVFSLFFAMPDESPGVPYSIWFLSGMLPWLFHAECLGTGVYCFSEYGYLVRKICFPVYLIPLIRLVSTFIIHILCIALLGALCIFENHFMQIRLIRLVYVCVCELFYTGTGLFVCALLAAFMRDMESLTAISLQAGIWAVPVLWNMRKVPRKFAELPALNPMYHVVQNFRYAFGCEETPGSGLSLAVFQSVCAVLLLLCILLYRKLRAHLPDVL